MNEKNSQPSSRQQLLAQFFPEISRNSTWTVMFHQAAAIKMGLNPTDVKCAGVLQESGAISAGELASLTGLTSGAITGVIDRLEKHGIAHRVFDPNDRRRVIIELNESMGQTPGAALVFGPLGAATGQLLAQYNDSELATILDFVQRSADLMKEQTARVLKENLPN